MTSRTKPPSVWSRWAKVVAVVVVVAVGGYWYIAEQREEQRGWDLVHQIGQGACDQAGEAVVALTAQQVSRTQAYNRVADAMTALGATTNAMRAYDLEYQGSLHRNPYDPVYAAMEDLAEAIDYAETRATSREHSRVAVACRDAALSTP